MSINVGLRFYIIALPMLDRYYTVHGYGTGLSGEFGEVMKAIEDCHKAVHAMGCPRVATGTFINLRQRFRYLPDHTLI